MSSRFAQFAQSDPDPVAVIESGGRRWSRQALYARVNSVAHALRQRGFGPGDVVAIVSPNCIEVVATSLAATEIGLYVLPVNWHLAAPEIAYMLENSGAQAVFVHERLAALVRQLSTHSAYAGLRTRVAFGRLPGFLCLEEFTAEQPTHRVDSPVLGRMLIYTSATTSRPKAVSAPIGDAARSLDRTLDLYKACGIAPEDDNVHLCASMLYHAGPLDCAILALHQGHVLVIVERWEAEQLLALIQEHRVTTAFMVPSMFVRLLKLPPQTRERYRVGSLRFVVHSAAPCPAPIKKQMLDWWGPVIWESYGAAEGGGTSIGPAEWLERPGSVGRPIPGTQLRILDDDGRELPPGQPGIIYLSRFTGDRFEYRGEPEKTRSAYRGELFTVGDIGYLDAEGYLFIRDRKIDLVISGGMNIYPAEIEQLLVQHPKVADCAVFGIPDPLMGEALCAIVQPAVGVVCDAAVSEELLAFLRKQVSSAKLPRVIKYAPELPRDPNGKLYKRILREPYWQGFERKI